MDTETTLEGAVIQTMLVNEHDHVVHWPGDLGVERVVGGEGPSFGILTGVVESCTCDRMTAR